MPYSGDPGASLEDEVRFMLGDTDTARPRLSDPEVAWLVSTYGSAVRAAYQGALRLEAHFSGKANKTVGPTSITYSGLAEQYAKLIERLASQGGATGSRIVPSGIVAGGLDDPMWSDVDWGRGSGNGQ